MAYKYQPIKDEMFVSDDEGELDEAEADDGATILGLVDGQTGREEAKVEPAKASKVKQVIEQDGVLILETVETDPNDPEALPQGSTIIASADLELTADMTGDLTADLEDSQILAELEREELKAGLEVEEEGELKESCHICGKQVAHLDKHILANHGEKVECQLCNQTFPVGNLRWHILKEHCHNKVTECSLCEQKFVTKNALKNHIKQIHLSETSTCHICHKEYKDLYHHVKYFHEKIRNYECSYCEKKFQAKKLLYNHVQSIHLGEKTNCPDCKKDISVDNFSRHVRETHERIKKPCPHCEKEFAMSNLSRHIRQVHNNESTECPDCGKALTISNLNKHIKSVHKKLKKTCDICNEEVPYSSISVHKRKVHNIGKPIDDVTPRGPNLKLRKRYQQMQNQEEEFDKLTEEDGTPARSYPQRKRRKVKREEEDTTDEEEEEDIDGEGLEDLDLEEGEEEMGSRTIQVGDKNFTFSFA